MKVLIINGAPKSGKDTFINFLSEQNGNIYAYSSIDYVKQKSIDNGWWDGVKDEKGRNLLSDLKDALTKYDDIPFKKIIKKILIARKEPENCDFFIVAIREPKEIDKLTQYCKQFNIPCGSLLIINDKAEQIVKESKQLNNTGDNNYMNYKYDYKLENNWTLDSFQRSVVDFLPSLNFLGRIQK